MDSKSEVNKINLIANINVDPIAENIWGFEEEAQHVQNTGFVFDNGVANLNMTDIPSSGEQFDQYVTANGDLLQLNNLSQASTSKPYTRDVNINGTLVDKINAYGVQYSGSYSGNDAATLWDDCVAVLNVKYDGVGTFTCNLIKYDPSINNSIVNNSTFTLGLPTSVFDSFQCGIIRKTPNEMKIDHYKAGTTSIGIWLAYYCAGSPAGQRFNFVIFNDFTGANNPTWKLQTTGATAGFGPSFSNFNPGSATARGSDNSFRLTCIKIYNQEQYVVGANGYLYTNSSPAATSQGLPFYMYTGAAGVLTPVATMTEDTSAMSSCFIWHLHANGNNNYNAVAITGVNTGPVPANGILPASVLVLDVVGYPNFNNTLNKFTAPATVTYGGNLLDVVAFYNTLVYTTDTNGSASPFLYPYVESLSVSNRFVLANNINPTSRLSRDLMIRRSLLSRANSISVGGGFDDLSCFCATFYKTPKSPLAAGVISVAVANSSSDLENQGAVLMGVPLSEFGAYDISFMPQLGNFNSILWAELDGTFKYVKIGNVPQDKLIRKINNNLYKINSIDPLNIFDNSTNTLELGSNDYSGQFRTVFQNALNFATDRTTTGSVVIQSKYANSIDYDDQTLYTNNTNLNGTSSQSFLLSGGINIGAEISKFIHGGARNYYTVTVYDNGRVLKTNTQGGYPAGIPYFDCYGNSFGGVPDPTNTPGATQRWYEYQPSLNQYNTYPTHVRNQTNPIPLPAIYNPGTLPTNSSAKGAIYNKTYITSGYRGSVITSDYDGYITGNVYPFQGDVFSLYSQGYIFDGKSIYAITINSNAVQLPPVKVIDCMGLRYIGYSPELAFFYSDMDRSLWAFDGGRTMQKVKKLDGFPQVQKAQYNTRDDALLLDVQTGWLWYREGRTTYNPRTAAQLVNPTSAKFYDTAKGVYIMVNTDLYHYSYTTETVTFGANSYTSAIVPFTIQTGYIGPSNNQRMILSAVTFGIYNEDRTPISFDVTMQGYDQDKFYTMKKQTFTVNQADYINGGIFRARVQDMNPQRVLAASFKLSTTSKIRIFELQYHWKEDVQALLPGGRSK